MRRREPGTVIGGLILLGTGLWLIASGLGAALPAFAAIWPLLPLALGLMFVVQHAAQHGAQPGSGSRGLLMLGLPLLLGGAFLLVFTLRLGGLGWADLAVLWPVFPLIVGLVFLLLYLSGDMIERPLLALTYLFGGVGLAALPLTLGVFRGPVFEQMARLWPLLIILAVLSAVLRVRLRRRELEQE